MTKWASSTIINLLKSNRSFTAKELKLKTESDPKFTFSLSQLLILRITPIFFTRTPEWTVMTFANKEGEADLGEEIQVFPYSTKNNNFCSQ